jgi:hypothetical protein
MDLVGLRREPLVDETDEIAERTGSRMHRHHAQADLVADDDHRRAMLADGV